jgi:predicted nucleic acid-binding protein
VKKLVLDTSILIEYIISRSPYRPKVVKLFNEALTNNIKLYISVITLSEILYVASRIYQVVGISDPNSEAQNFVEWIKGRTQIISVNEDIALRAGELKKKLHIALSDCYVIASAEAIGAIPVFKKIEREMKPVINNLRKLNVKFLDEISG